MTQHEFLDTLKQLFFIDQQPWMGDAFWRRFNNDPPKAFLKADDETAEKIWAMIKPPPDDWDAEIRDLKTSVIAFAGPWAVQHAREHGLPEGHLFQDHYDLLKRCGARMVDFTRGET